MDIYAPIAHRLGMGKLRGELEDLAFKNLHPDDYREITTQLEKTARGERSVSQRNHCDD
jgi:GTP pyrophosphokinase